MSTVIKVVATPFMALLMLALLIGASVAGFIWYRLMVALYDWVWSQWP